MGENNKKQGTVDFGTTFLDYYSNRYSETTKDKIDDFIEHVVENGLYGWIGKVSPSNKVPNTYPDQQKIIARANEHKLWHAHIGEPCFKDSWNGNYKVSNWVIHFQKFNNWHIKLLELDYHNPMTLPSDTIINKK